MAWKERIIAGAGDVAVGYRGDCRGMGAIGFWACTILMPFLVLPAMLYTRSFYGVSAAFHRLKPYPAHA
jgi:hypothetical protein